MLNVWKREAEGRVFNIQKFSIDDGPGIRTTVFFKGCPLRCLWCSNPESVMPYPEIITSFERQCRNCNRCLDACGDRAIAFKGRRTLDRKRCNLCMKCVVVCPAGALRSIGETRSVQEVAQIVEQDRIFYETSGGGVTLSGGEPLAQPEFAIALLRECKKRGLHTALDTCGKAGREVLHDALPYLDLVLYDVKHVDSNAHKKYTGSGNAEIMENLSYLSGKVDVWMRVPLIPGFNDDEETLAALMALGREVQVEKICFLPYHRWGTGKYAGLGRKYPLERLDHVTDRTLAGICRLSRPEGMVRVEILS